MNDQDYDQDWQKENDWRDYGEDRQDFDEFNPHYSGYCRDCGQWVEATVTEDHGIGGYEFRGVKGTDTRLVEVCPHCGGVEVEEGATLPCMTCGHFDRPDHELECELDGVDMYEMEFKACKWWVEESRG